MIKATVNEDGCGVEISGKGGDIHTEFSSIARSMFETFPEIIVKHAMLLGESMADKSKVEKHMSSDLRNMEKALRALAEELRKMEEK